MKLFRKHRRNPEADLIELAWGIIANASGCWHNPECSEWQEAAERWRDDYHKWLEETR